MKQKNKFPEHSPGRDPLKQPLMSTGTTEPGFDKNRNDKQKAEAPKIGETLIGDDGITGRIR